jgi:hypothetical protein
VSRLLRGDEEQLEVRVHLSVPHVAVGLTTFASCLANSVRLPSSLVVMELPESALRP